MKLKKLQLKKETAAVANVTTLEAVADKLNKQHSCSHLRFNSMPTDTDPHSRKYLAKLGKGANFWVLTTL